MADNKFSCSANGAAARETYGIEAGRILDACRDRDCFEDVRVYLTALGQDLITRTGNVRVKKACIVGANIVTDPVQFSSGFYAVDIKFYVSCTFEVCVPPGNAQEFDGIAVVEKRVVLYGGESNVNVFRSVEGGDYCSLPEFVCCSKKHPEAIVEVVDPIVLAAKITEDPTCCNCCCCCEDIPGSVCDRINGALVGEGEGDNRYLTVSLGFFSVIRLVRDGQFLIQASEYCLPEKECCAPSQDDPCATFRSLPFPAGEFCPQNTPTTAINGLSGRCRCTNS
jgi:hypothetical protein